MIRPFNIGGNPYVGVYARANNHFVFLPEGYNISHPEEIEPSLGVDKVFMTVEGAHVLGSMLVLNSDKALVSSLVTEKEISMVAEHMDVERLPGPLTAVGNNVLMNDKAALVNPALDDEALDFMRDFLGIGVERGTIAGVGVVGSTSVVTQKGILCHPKIKRDEKKQVRDLFGFDEIKIGTGNYGVPYVGACMVANDQGALVGDKSTGIEMGRVEEALDLI